jgi:hypothetical protein
MSIDASANAQETFRRMNEERLVREQTNYYRAQARQANNNKGNDGVGLLIMAAIVLGSFFLPTILAISAKKASTVAIAICNVLLAGLIALGMTEDVRAQLGGTILTRGTGRNEGRISGRIFRRRLVRARIRTRI